MSKKNMSLKEWLEKEFELKKEFLSKEAVKGDIIRRVNIEKNFFTLEPITIEQNQQLWTLDFPYDQTFNCRLTIDNGTFEILKQRFRTFKFQKKNKIEDRVKLQIHLKKKTYLQLERTSNENGLKDISDCLDFLTNKHDTIQQKHNKEVEILRAELRTKEDEIGTLKYSISIYKKIINNEKNNKRKSRDDLVDYLTQVAIKATCKIAQYESFINNQPDLNTEVIPLLSQEETQKIKSEFEKELELTRLKIYASNSSYLVEGVDNLTY
ncbi:hypothetical protein [Acinetobacter parvus]|uniref:Uncharacterized protein n=1 Tax=Acinetobacter parvus NIPH 1103 TaxID=1217671 RepID=N8Q4E4_9GAMM|nr:hypothetical protein [Acinetobacter parvus]ENU33405.1 hypothetical protein F989_01607 [Acinetobacter parvus NIPH 1103]